jgi:protein-disulfide isomerase
MMSIDSSSSRFRLVALTAVPLVAGALTFAVATRTCAAASQGEQAAASPAASTTIAVVDGETITLADLEAALGTSLSKLEQDLYNLKKERLDAMIGEKLLAREAAKRGVDVSKLVETEVTSKIPPVTDAEVDAFHEANKARLPTSADIKSQIKQYLSQQRLQSRGQAFIAELRNASKVEVALPAPPIRRTTLQTEGAPIRGDAAAPVTVVEFSDFHCPFCKRVQPTLLELLDKYPGKVRIVYKDLPLDSLHPQARKVSEAARCARDQGKFWEYHDKVYGGSPDGSPEYLRKLASDLSLDMTAFDQCVTNGKHKAAIDADLAQAAQLGLTGTPAFFINGRALQGAQPLEAFMQVIDQELSQGAK